MTQNNLKLSVAKAALAYIPKGIILGVGTGSTVNFLIDELASIKNDLLGAVASSEATANRLRTHNINVLDLNDVTSIPLYIDGADEITPKGEMIKGGGGALTREKIIASVSDQFLCIVDESKLVQQLGTFALPIEVIPMSVNAVSKTLKTFGGIPKLRQKDNHPFVTDNGNYIIDVSGLAIKNPKALERDLNDIVGVVTVGLFANRAANTCLMGTKDGVKKLQFK